MGGPWTPEHHAAYRATVEARRAAVAGGERAPFKRNAPLTEAERHSAAEAMDRALAGVGARIAEAPPRRAARGVQPKDKRCLCTHTHYRGQPDPKNGNRRPDLGCTEKGCPCPGWRRRGMPGAETLSFAGIVPNSDPDLDVVALTDAPEGEVVTHKRCACTHYHRRGPLAAGKRPDLGCADECGCPRWHRNVLVDAIRRERAPARQIRPVRHESPKATHPEPERIQGQSPAEYVKSELALLGRETGEMLRVLEVAAGTDAKVLDRIESVRQMVLRLTDRVALQPLSRSSKALVPISADDLWRAQVEKALVRILTEQRRQAATLEAIRVEMARVASRPSVIREFRPVHRRTADGGHPVSRQRRRAGVGRAPRVVEPTARAG